MARPQYLNQNGYTVVITPHFQTQWMEARYGTGTQTMAQAGASFDSVAAHFDFFFEIAKAARVTCGTEYSTYSANIYYRALFNNRRGRYELELISVTPHNSFNTFGRNETGHTHATTRRVELP